jgi:hypothetical protein
MTPQASWDPHSADFAEHETIADGQSDRSISAVASIASSIYSLKMQRIENLVLQPASLMDGLDFTRLAQETVTISSTMSGKRQSTVQKEELARLWGVGLEAAERTIQATSQLVVRNALHPIQRRFRTEVAQLRYNRLGGRHGQFYSDTMCGPKSLRQNAMCQIFVNDIDFVKCIPMGLKSQAGDALEEFLQDVGIPASMHVDAKEQSLAKWGTTVKKFGICQTQMEPYSPWQNRTELTIQEIKKGVRHFMQSRRVPNCLWDFCAVYVCELRCLTVHGHFSMHGRTPYEMTTSQTPDISEYSEFRFYEMLWYYDEMAVFPEDRRKLGRWLGVAHRIGQALCYYLLNSNAQIIVRSTVQKMTQDEKQAENTRNAMQEFDQEIASRIGKCGASPPIEVSRRRENLEVDSRIMFDEYDNKAEGPTEPMEPEAEKPEIAEFTTEAYDKFISAEVMLLKGDILVPAQVVGHKRGQDGNPIGQENTNPLLDSRVYEVEFPDGHIEEYVANIIAKNIYAEVDAEGNHFLIMDEITGHKVDENALSKDERVI